MERFGIEVKKNDASLYFFVFDFDFEQVCGSGEPGAMPRITLLRTSWRWQNWTGMVRCWISCYKNPTYVAGTGTAASLERSRSINVAAKDKDKRFKNLCGIKP